MLAGYETGRGPDFCHLRSSLRRFRCITHTRTRARCTVSCSSEMTSSVGLWGSAGVPSVTLGSVLSCIIQPVWNSPRGPGGLTRCCRRGGLSRRMRSEVRRESDGNTGRDLQGVTSQRQSPGVWTRYQHPRDLEKIYIPGGHRNTHIECIIQNCINA